IGGLDGDAAAGQGHVDGRRPVHPGAEGAGGEGDGAGERAADDADCDAGADVERAAVDGEGRRAGGDVGVVAEGDPLDGADAAGEGGVACVVGFVPSAVVL